MNPVLRTAEICGLELQKLLNRQEVSDVVADGPRFSAVLKDLWGGPPIERRLIVRALEAGIPAELRAAKVTKDSTIVTRTLAVRLVHNEGLSQESAAWGVSVWAVALGIPLEQTHSNVQASPPVAHPPKLPVSPVKPTPIVQQTPAGSQKSGAYVPLLPGPQVPPLPTWPGPPPTLPPSAARKSNSLRAWVPLAVLGVIPIIALIMNLRGQRQEASPWMPPGNAETVTPMMDSTGMGLAAGLLLTRDVTAGEAVSSDQIQVIDGTVSPADPTNPSDLAGFFFVHNMSRGARLRWEDLTTVPPQ